MLYDVSSIPPVKRTMPKAAIKSADSVKSSGVFDHTVLRFSRQELLDLSAFVGNSPAR